MKYSAVIVDNRPIHERVIKNHMKLLPDDWFLNVFSTTDYYLDIPHYRHLYKGVTSKSQGDHQMAYNAFITSSNFWITLAKYDRVLIFQQDSGILREGIEEFLKWSYVGAPWKENAPWARKDRAGGNGGLSIREPREMMRIIRTDPWKPDKGNEDVYFTHRAKNIAPYEVCKRFSVESEFELGTFGYHGLETQAKAPYNNLTLEQVRQIKKGR